MASWSRAAYLVHIVWAVIAAIGFFRYWGRTRFWLPRYVHYLAAIALAIGIALVAITPPTAPSNRGGWTGLKQAAMVLVFPALVYFVFVFFGGQQAAHDHNHQRAVCLYCGASHGLAAPKCPNCGQ